MPRKKGKKKSGPEDAPQIPGLSSVRNVPGSSSREQPPVSAASVAGSRQRPKEQAAAPTQLPRQPETSGPGRSRQDAPDSEVPATPKMRDDPASPSASESSDRDLRQQFSKMALVPMPKKPEKPGRLGRPISLLSNLYPLRFNSCYVYHYDVEIARLGASFTDPGSGPSPDSSQYRDARKKYKCLNTKVNRKVFKKLCDENFRGYFAVFDGEKNAYCMKQLPVGDLEPFEPFEVRIEAENRGDPKDPRGPRMDKFEVVIKPVRKKESNDNIINLEPLNALFKGQTTSVPLEAVMVLETVLRYVPCLRFVPVGRNFFSPPDYKQPLGNGKEVWFGHHQSVRLAQKTAVVNLNMSASSFYESIPVVEYIEKLTGRNLRQVAGLDKNDIIKINKDMRNICIETTHLPYRRKYRIDGLSEESANKKKFNLDNQEVTVEQYYRTRYNVRLKYPHLPCLKVKKKDSCLPMEVCEIVKGQHSSKELNPKQQAEMIKYTAKPPQERFREIETVYKNSDYDNDPYLRCFGLRVLDKPIRVDGRMMEAPNVVYRQNTHEFRERPRNGTWNMRDKQFFTGTRIDKWTLLSFATEQDCHYGKLQQFSGALQRFANEQGVIMGKCSHIEIAEAKLQSISLHLKNMKDRFSAKLIFVVLPSERQRVPGKQDKLSQVLYSEVKRLAETTELGIVTQCVKAENVFSKGTNPSFVSNLCLKMNAKMGGVNNSMVPAEVSMRPEEHILFVGADVNHPAPTENTAYSLAAAVGNVDNHPSRYAVIVRPQKNDENYKKMVEVIMNMQEMMRSLLLAYYKTTRAKPKKIIIYRDGVSDGQFSDVQEREIKWIRAACTGLEAGYRPGITFVVIQKRHHVRFLDRRGNPAPGTVIDTEVTHPLNYDFFLYSHSGMKGTSRPSYYTVLADDNKYSFDELEKMTYSLCHTYVRCTKSISLPAPVQYADLAAYRARRHLHSYLTDQEAKGKMKKGENNKFNIPIEKVREIIDVKDSMKDTMYYA